MRSLGASSNNDESSFKLYKYKSYINTKVSKNENNYRYFFNEIREEANRLFTFNNKFKEMNN